MVAAITERTDEKDEGEIIEMARLERGIRAIVGETQNFVADL